MLVHTYCVEHDLGFAPNPFHGVCSLGCCAPQLRQHASVGDIVVGRGSARVGRRNSLVYWMQVDEILSFDEYNADPRFASKIPDMAASTMLRYGDNIYYTDPTTKEFIQRDSFHSNENGVQSAADIKTDTGTTTNVLLGQRYSYFGGAGPEIPEKFRSMFPKRNRACHHRDDLKNALLAWLNIDDPKGIVGLPTDWADIPH
jgi:hypothetical protein